ncbi:MAG: hypothetical protein H6811_00415 [Phycisphaeraceae bacterium]|nr:hypothetical protein [Phycisphaeraceae bacterium]
MRTTEWVSALGLAWMACAASAQLYGVGGGGPSGIPGDQVNQKSGTTVGGVGGGAGSGAGMPGDDMNGASEDGDDDDVTLCFSVDAASQGMSRRVGPGGIPGINVFHQANRNQQAGDVFISTEAWNTQTGMLGVPPGLGLFDNVLAINQGRGWVDPVGFGLQPNVSPLQFVPPGTPSDNVDMFSAPSAPFGQPNSVFFTLGVGSQSLLTLPGNPSLDRGGDVFFDPDITMGGDEQLFVEAAQLNLLPGDDIDGLTVIDRDDDRRFTPGLDSVFFSLSRESPTLGVLGASAADVFVVDAAGFHLFASHRDLGLLFSDNIDALHFDPLVNGNVFDTIMSKLPSPGALPVLGMLTLIRPRRGQRG